MSRVLMVNEAAQLSDLPMGEDLEVNEAAQLSDLPMGEDLEVIVVGGSRIGRAAIERELERVMLAGNREPGDPVPLGLMQTATRTRPFDDSEADRVRWNAEVDRRKAERKQK